MKNRNYIYTIPSNWQLEQRIGHTISSFRYRLHARHKIVFVF